MRHSIHWQRIDLSFTEWAGSRRGTTFWYGCFFSNFGPCSKDIWNRWHTHAEESIVLVEHKQKQNKIIVFSIYMCLILLLFICIIGLPQFNLMSPQQSEDIQLPPGTKPIKDLRVSPCGRFALLASLGKKLSFLRFAYSIFLANVTIWWNLLEFYFQVQLFFGIYLFCFVFQFGEQQFCHHLWLTGIIFPILCVASLENKCCCLSASVCVCPAEYFHCRISHFSFFLY